MTDTSFNMALSFLVAESTYDELIEIVEEKIQQYKIDKDPVPVCAHMMIILTKYRMAKVTGNDNTKIFEELEKLRKEKEIFTTTPS